VAHTQSYITGYAGHASLAWARAVQALLKGKLFLFVARLAGAGAGFLVQVLLARTLTSDGLGTFYTATSLAVIASLVASAGYDGITARFVLRYKERKNAFLHASFVRQVWREAGIAALALASLPLAFAIFWPTIGQDARLALIVAAISIPALMSLRIVGGFAGAERRFSLALLPEILLRPFMFLLIVAALVGLGVDMTGSIAVLLFALLAYLAALVQYSPLAKVLPHAKVAAPRRMTAYWRKQALPMMVVVMFTALFADLAVVVQSPFLNPAEIARFGVCMKIAMLIGFVVQVSHSLVLPDLADAYAQRKKGAVRALLLKAAPFPISVSVLALIGIGTFGEQLLLLFGPEFASANGALFCLVACQAVRAIAGPGPSLLMLQGAQKQNLWISVCSCMQLVVGSTVLSSQFGLWGAVGATSAAYCFWIIASALCLHRMGAPRTDLFGIVGR
jgi:O-antigen/teichoic acid export membrane protein